MPTTGALVHSLTQRSGYNAHHWCPGQLANLEEWLQCPPLVPWSICLPRGVATMPTICALVHLLT